MLKIFKQHLGDNLFLFEVGKVNFCRSHQQSVRGYPWVGENSLRPRRLRFEKPLVKTLLIFFFDSSVVVHKEFVPKGVTSNSQYYNAVLWKNSKTDWKCSACPIFLHLCLSLCMIMHLLMPLQYFNEY